MMIKVTRNKIVSIHYSVLDEYGIVADSNIDFEPLHYLHGAGNILPALEDVLEGATEGELIEVLLLPHQAFGEYKDELVFSIDNSAILECPGVVEPGMTVHTTDGTEMLVMELCPGKLLVTSNHALAGKKLYFKVWVKEIRQATANELLSGQPIKNREACGPECSCHLPA